jgi:hypothetical protein
MVRSHKYHHHNFYTTTTTTFIPTYIPVLPFAEELQDDRIAGWGTWCWLGTGKSRKDTKRVYNLFDYWFYLEEIDEFVVPLGKPVKTGK